MLNPGLEKYWQSSSTLIIACVIVLIAILLSICWTQRWLTLLNFTRSSSGTGRGSNLSINNLWYWNSSKFYNFSFDNISLKTEKVYGHFGPMYLGQSDQIGTNLSSISAKKNCPFGQQKKKKFIYSSGCKFVYLVLKNPPFYFVFGDRI
jgi:hypothetical protein